MDISDHADRSRSPKGRTDQKCNSSRADVFEVFIFSMDCKKASFKAITKILRQSGVRFILWSGVLVDNEIWAQSIKDGLIAQSTEIKYRGTMGCALAHLSLFRHVSRMTDGGKSIVVLEDDELLTVALLEALAATLQQLDQLGCISWGLILAILLVVPPPPLLRIPQVLQDWSKACKIDKVNLSLHAD